MAANVELIEPSKISPNPDNPRLIFRQKELDELESSISNQGILVPLTIYRDGRKFVILDGERRWKCAQKLGLHKVPVIIQPKPARVQNIMMMFAIHNARRDWDPLPTALKLQELETQLEKARRKKLTESELAAAASLTRGAVRRYRKILRIPKDIQKSLLKDLEDPTSEQSVTVDQVIEAIDAAESLTAAKVLKPAEERQVVDAIVEKFRAKVIQNTVEPRKIGAIGRFVRDGAISVQSARKEILRFSSRLDVTITDVVSATSEDVEHQKSLERGLKSFEEKWIPDLERHRNLIPKFKRRIQELIARLQALI